MKCSEKIKVICAGLNISIAELARRTGQSPQNLNGKLKRGTITDEEFVILAKKLDMVYEQTFTLPNGVKLTFTNGGDINEFKC